MTHDARIAWGRWARSAAVCAGLAAVGCTSLFDSRDTTPPTAPAPAPTRPGKAKPLRVSQFVFYSDQPLKENAPLFQELSRLRDQIFSDLSLPPSNTVVQVYLFDNQEKYEQYMRYRYPDLPTRRAFFVAHPGMAGGAKDLIVYTFWGDHVRQDLRHELTHALLNSVLKEVPLWLDEGLAEHYELPPERNGVNALHLDAIRAGNVAPDLAALERLEKVWQMGRPQYQEAWAWAHFLLHGPPQNREILLAYLQQLRDPNHPGTLLPRLRTAHPAPEQALASHLAEIAAPAAALRPVVAGP